MNAADVYPNRLLTWGREAEDLAQLGYAVSELDLRDYWGAEPGELAGELADAALLWCVGGNAFTLARAATAAGLRDALSMTSDLTFGGYSAGACLAGVDLQGVEAMDDPTAAPSGYSLDMPADTLRLIDGRVIPHGGTTDANDAERLLARRGLGFLTLKDGEDVYFTPPPPAVA